MLIYNELDIDYIARFKLSLMSGLNHFRNIYIIVIA
jgi:hypothetical protein